MKRSLSVVLALGGLALPGTAHAVYGPESGQPTAAPGGFSEVVTSKTVGEDGATLRGSAGKAKVVVSVPAGAFDEAVQLRVVKPKMASLAKAVRKAAGKGARALAGMGLAASARTGESLAELPGKVRVSIQVRSLPRDAYVVRYDAKRRKWVKVRFTRKSGAVQVDLTKPTALAVVDPA
jgi:hypothetical protein